MAFDVADGDELLAGARVVVLDDHVDGELGGVPVLIDDGDVFTGGAHGRGDDVGLADAGEGEAVERLGADIFLFEVGIVYRRARGSGVWRRGRRTGVDALAGDVLEGVVKDIEATRRVVDMSGEKLGFAFETSGDKLPALVVDAP